MKLSSLAGVLLGSRKARSSSCYCFCCREGGWKYTGDRGFKGGWWGKQGKKDERVSSRRSRLMRRKEFCGNVMCGVVGREVGAILKR